MHRIAMFFKDLLQFLILLGILLMPFKWHLFSFHTDVINFLFFPIVRSVAGLLGIQLTLTDLSSDSTGLYIHAGIIFLIAIITSLYTATRMDDARRSKITGIIRTIASYYLALLLLKYGLDKFMKSQFYLPEPNILFTPLGKLDKDILFWSAMGSSYSYNVFMGIAEVIPALLLIIPRTRQIGALIATGVFLNIFAINLSFDISVKIFSFFLLLISFNLAIPIFKRLVNQKLEPIKKPNAFVKWRKPFHRQIVLSFLLVLIFTESLYPLTIAQNWNDDVADRPYLHGAYESVDKQSAIKRVFVHRDGYLVFQDQSDNFTDLKLDIDQVGRKFKVQDYDQHQTAIPYQWDNRSGHLTLHIAGQNLEFSSIDWKRLPLLKQQFHWTVD